MKREDFAALAKFLRGRYRLDWRGIHGAGHWIRVRANGLRLAPLTGADPIVVELFAVLHDVCRWGDGSDMEHGARSAELVVELCDDLLRIRNEQAELLSFACRYHSHGRTEADVTVQTCWDADRLDLGRVGIRPNPRFLCTAAARSSETIAWAYARSLGAVASGVRGANQRRSAVAKSREHDDGYATRRTAS